MYRNILIATDGSELAGKAVRHGLSLAKAVGADVTAVTVTDMWSVGDMASAAKMAGLRATSPVEDFETQAKARAQAILDDVAAGAKATGVACVCVHVPDSRPSEAILKVADESACDLIVLSTHGRTGLARLVIGSQAQEVIGGAKVPVMVVR